MGRRSKMNWGESELLVKHTSPEEPVSAEGVAAYLDEVESYARAVLHDLGIDDPVIPLPIATRYELFDEENFEDHADGAVAVQLLENVSFLKSLLTIEIPTSQQVNCMLWMMAQISRLTSMPYIGTARLLRDKVATQRAARKRCADIRRDRSAGEKIATLAKKYGLTERRIKQIVANN